MNPRIAPTRFAFALLAAILLGATMLSPRSASAAGGIITTVAGGGVGDGGPATSASVNRSIDVALDGGANLYIADVDNCRVRKVSGGTITTVAGDGSCGYSGDGGPATSASVDRPQGVALDGAGNVYFASACRVRKVSGGTITTVAGNGTCAYSGDGGAATVASLASPHGVVLDSGGNLYIADQSNCRIRKVSGGTITTVAGNGTCTYGGDGGAATSASLSFPAGVALDGGGNLYIGDLFNCRIRMVSGGVISTVAGNGTCAYSGDGGPAPSASLNQPNGVAVDGSGNLYIGDSSCRVRKVSAGTITTVAGNGTCVYSGDGGAATGAGLFSTGVAVGGGDLYIADEHNCRVRKVSGGTISTVAGNGLCVYGDGGPATSASLNAPRAVGLDRGGDLYIAEETNCRVRKVSGGTITTTAGGTCGFGGDGGPATSASLNQPVGVAVDRGGNLFIADLTNCRVREVSGGTITTVAGNGTCANSGDGGAATSAGLDLPWAVAVDGGGNLYIIVGGCRVRKVSGGTITTVAGNGACATNSGDGGVATNASLNYPQGVAVDGSGNLYIASGCSVRMVSGGTITTVAGTGTCASLSASTSVAVDSGSNLYIGELFNCRVRKVSAGAITTVAGSGTCAYGGDGGPAASASMIRPWGVAVDGGGNLYIADQGSQRIRRVDGVASRDHKTDANGDGYSAADEATIANCGVASCASISTWGTAETRTCKDAGANCGSPGAPADESVPARIAVPPAGGYGCSVTLDTVGTKTTRKLAQSDIDLDGVVSILDLVKVAGWYGNAINPSPADPRWEGDMDGDGVISILDLVAMASNFGRSVAGNCKVE